MDRVASKRDETIATPRDTKKLFVGGRRLGPTEAVGAVYDRAVGADRDEAATAPRDVAKLGQRPSTRVRVHPIGAFVAVDDRSVPLPPRSDRRFRLFREGVDRSR